MKVAVFTPVFWPYRGGIGKVAANEAEELKKIGCEVDIFTPCYLENCLTEEKWQGLKLFRLKTLFKFGNAAKIKFDSSVLDQYDVVHLHYPFIGGVSNLLKWKKNSSKPLVVTYHMDLIGYGWRGFFFKIYSWLVLPKLIKHSNKIIFSSWDYGQNSLLSKYLKEKSEKFIEIPFGIKISQNKLSKKEARQQFNLKEKEKIILFVGGLDKAHHFKGLEVLFLAIKKVILKLSNNLRVIIIGEGELKSFYKKLGDKMNIGNYLNFIGKTDDEELVKYYQAGDVFVLPSINSSEAYGLVLLEAQSQGLPVIASFLPGVRQQVDKDRGFLFQLKDHQDLADKIIHVLSDDDLSKKMGEVGKKWILDNRLIEQEAKSLLSVYNSVVN